MMQQEQTPAPDGLEPDTGGRRLRGAGLRTAGSIRSRRGLPNGRAVAGGLLMAVAYLGAWFVATSGDAEPTTTYVVAARDLGPGHVLTADDLELVALDLQPTQARTVYGSADTLVGAVTTGAVSDGGLIGRSAVQLGGIADEQNSTTYREVSLAVSPARAVGGTLRPGDLVDVISTDGDTSTVLVQRALVLAATRPSSGALGGGGDLTVTLALDQPSEALAVAHGAAATDLTLVRATRTNDALPTAHPAPDPAPLLAQSAEEVPS